MDMHILIPGTGDCFLPWQRELGRCDQVKVLEVETLSWAKCNHKGPYKRQAEGELSTEEKRAM